MVPFWIASRRESAVAYRGLLSSGNTDTFTYDDNGNRTQWTRSSDATISYIYNGADQLTQSTEGTIGTSYSHDNNGRRASAPEASSAGERTGWARTCRARLR